MSYSLISDRSHIPYMSSVPLYSDINIVLILFAFHSFFFFLFYTRISATRWLWWRRRIWRLPTTGRLRRIPAAPAAGLLRSSPARIRHGPGCRSLWTAAAGIRRLPSTAAGSSPFSGRCGWSMEGGSSSGRPSLLLQLGHWRNAVDQARWNAVRIYLMNELVLLVAG